MRRIALVTEPPERHTAPTPRIIGKRMNLYRTVHPISVDDLAQYDDISGRLRPGCFLRQRIRPLP